MNPQLPEQLFSKYEQGALSRRDLIAKLVGLGVAMAAVEGPAAEPADDSSPVFKGKGLDHIALNVTNVARSRDFYAKHLGLTVQRDGGEQRCFMGPPGGDFILALFRSNSPGMNHYCFGTPGYQPDEAMEKLSKAGARPRREGDRIYFPDPDGITVQLAKWTPT